MALRIRYQRAVSRAVSVLIRDQRKQEGFESWWQSLDIESQRKLKDRWERLVGGCLEYPDEDTRQQIEGE